MSYFPLPTKHPIRAAWLSLPKEAADSACVRFSRRGWFVAALVGGYLLFCHGCHGDEDDELLAAIRLHGAPPAAFMAAALPSARVGVTSAPSVPAALWMRGLAASPGYGDHRRAQSPPR